MSEVLFDFAVREIEQECMTLAHNYDVE